MKKINDEILKYLSDMMDDREKREFENKLNTSAELKKQLDEAEQMLNNLSAVNDTAVNEQYFTNLLPRARMKMEKKKKIGIVKKISFAVPVLASAVMLFFLFSPEKVRVIEDQPQVLVNNVLENVSDKEIAEQVVNDVYFESSMMYGESSELLSETELPENITVSKDKLFSVVDLAYTDYTTLQNLSDEDFNEIYQKLSMITLQ